MYLFVFFGVFQIKQTQRCYEQRVCVTIEQKQNIINVTLKLKKNLRDVLTKKKNCSQLYVTYDSVLNLR